MNDKEIEAIVPEWGRFSKKKRDKVFGEYQMSRIGDSNSAAWQALEKNADVFIRERMLSLLGPFIDSHNMPGIMGIIQLSGLSSFGELFETEPTNQARDQLALDIWEHAGAALVRSLDSRDSMLAQFTTDILGEVVPRVGRAASMIQKSAKYAAFYRWCLTNDDKPGLNMMTTPVMQHGSMKLMVLVLYTCSKRFYDELYNDRAILATIQVFEKATDSSLISLAACVIEACCSFAEVHNKVDTDLYRRAHTSACVRALKTDMQKETHGYTDIGEIVGPIAQVLRMLAVVIRIPVPERVLKHIKPFGDGYTNSEPRDPLERDRWSNRYHVMRLCEVDWASENQQAEGKELLQTIRERFKMMDKDRRANIQCAQCQKKEDSFSDERLNKCSRCKIVFYCSRECQQRHWPTHRTSCKKPDRSSLPERMLSFEENIGRLHAAGTAGGDTFYPAIFVLWLDEKYHQKE
jgi:hypothetical protein